VELNTFSIAARCPRTGMLGVAVATALPGVGALCPFAKAGVGAIASQSMVNPYLAIDGLRLLEQGVGPAEVLDRLVSQDPVRGLRQVGIVDASGASAAWSGEECAEWFGHRTGPDYAVQGNLLVSEATLEAMTSTFEQTADEDLRERLMKVLEAGQSAGGDSRGRQSAALYVVRNEEYPYLDLRVDEHTDAVGDLRRVLEIAKRQLYPFIELLPTRANPSGQEDDEVLEMLLRSPRER
jgi:uncharacterized Ntn-hydrolase superfamily protein